MSVEDEQAEVAPKEKSTITRLGVSPLAFIITVVVSVVFMPTVILLLGGMMPSMMAYILDDTRKKAKAKTVAYMNLSGCFIVGMELWTGDNSVDAAIGVFLQPVNWVLMYGLAMAGWILIKSLNPFITSYLRLNYQMQQRNLRKRRKQLLAEWGEPVATVTPDGEFVYDKNVYLDDDEVESDPDEKLDYIPDDHAQETLQITNEGDDIAQEKR